MGDQIRIPRAVITFFPFPFEGDIKDCRTPGLVIVIVIVIERNWTLPLCDVVSSISQPFVPHFSMSAFTSIYLQHRIN